MIPEYFKSAAGVVGMLAVIIGGAIAVDDRYAHAGDIKELSLQLEMNRISSDLALLEIRRNMLQDKIFETTVRGTGTLAEREIIERHRRELADVERQIVNKRRALDTLPSSKQQWK